MHSTDIGKKGEDLVSDELLRLGHKIISKNWRTKWCEIDVISTLDNCVYFTEVKYRGSNEWGSGLDYIIEKKLRQMRFAAEFWLTSNDWQKESTLQGAEVDFDGNINLVEIY